MPFRCCYWVIWYVDLQLKYVFPKCSVGNCMKLLQALGDIAKLIGWQWAKMMRYRNQFICTDELQNKWWNEILEIILFFYFEWILRMIDVNDSWILCISHHWCSLPIQIQCWIIISFWKIWEQIKSEMTIDFFCLLFQQKKRKKELR